MNTIWLARLPGRRALEGLLGLESRRILSVSRPLRLLLSGVLGTLRFIRFMFERFGTVHPEARRRAPSPGPRRRTRLRHFGNLWSVRQPIRAGRLNDAAE
jgi:hypothetical protein